MKAGNNTDAATITMIQISPAQLQDMLDRAAEKAVTLAARVTGEQWGVTELAAHYGVSVRTIRNRELAGELPPRVGRRWLRADVLRWDEDRRPK
ncbi:MAG: hypothetical protein Q4A98_05920 [Comamonadaceae bacterium]|nr:hypothetical protein [Comamonadaceae bacterium]